MKRAEFIKHGAIASLSLSLFNRVKAGTGSHAATPEETEGPFPTHKPATLVAQKITGDRSGLPLMINITVYNINHNCAGLKGALVDIWHCDSKGKYSEYGGEDEHGSMGGPGGPGIPPPDGGHPPDDSLHKQNGASMPALPIGGGSMQAANHVKEHFLRGRQTTNSNGQVSFHSIYPGWYAGRAPHIHVHIYNDKGQSLLVTQIAFPEDVSKAVYAGGVYAAHGLPDTTNAADMVFNDSIANELATLTGNPRDGYVLTHGIYVKA